MKNVFEMAKTTAVNWIENTDMATIGKTVAGIASIVGGILIIMGDSADDAAVQAVVEETIPSSIPVEPVVETVTDAAETVADAVK